MNILKNDKLKTKREKKERKNSKIENILDFDKFLEILFANDTKKESTYTEKSENKSNSYLLKKKSRPKGIKSEKLSKLKYNQK